MSSDTSPRMKTIMKFDDYNEYDLKALNSLFIKKNNYN